MKVIVTGGSGYIGQVVVKHLAQRGHEVINIDRRPASGPGEFVFMDLRRRELLQPVMERAQAIIHMGEIPNARMGGCAEEIYANNTTVGALVFQLAAELKYQRVIYTSSMQVYGFCDVGAIAPAQLPIDENHPLQPQNVYALGKVAIENYARLCAQKNGLRVAAFRLPWVFSEEIDEGWFHWLDRQETLRADLGIYIRNTDVAECFALALEKPRPGFEAYNISAREIMFNEPLRQAVARDLPNYPQLPENWGKFDSAYLSNKAREHFGWQPTWNLLDEFRKKYGRDPQPRSK